LFFIDNIKIYIIFIMFKNANKFEIARAFQKPVKIDRKDEHTLKKLKIKKELKKLLNK